jgi:hypothetical protein
MSTPTSPVIHTPAHKQVDTEKQPAQIKNVGVQAVKQDKEQAK